MKGVTKLEQLRSMTTVVADTGAIGDIKIYNPQDATTNPSLLLKASLMAEYSYIFEKAIEKNKDVVIENRLNAIIADLSVCFGVEILKEIPGRVSTEVDARLSFNTEATINYAKDLISRYKEQGINKDRVLIKIASTWEGIQAAYELEKLGISCNLTLLFSLVQAVASAEAGVTLISPFVGRITDWYMKRDNLTDYPCVTIDPGVQSVKEIYYYFKQFDFDTIVMGASFRHVKQVEALSGCDALTIAPNLLNQLKSDTNILIQALNQCSLDQRASKIDAKEQNFRWLMNEDAMATEKLAEGIRQFSIDTNKLEKLILDRIK